MRNNDRKALIFGFAALFAFAQQAAFAAPRSRKPANADKAKAVFQEKCKSCHAWEKLGFTKAKAMGGDLGDASPKLADASTLQKFVAKESKMEASGSKKGEHKKAIKLSKAEAEAIASQLGGHGK